MNKKIQTVLSVFMIIVIFGIQISYAVQVNEETDFFEVNTTDKKLEMIFNINKIEYDKFKIVLNSNIDNEKIYTYENVEIEEESNAITIEIDKTKLNLNEIKLCYEFGEINTDTIIQLNAKVIIDEEVEEQDEEGNVEILKQEKIVVDVKKNVTLTQKNEKENNETNEIISNNSEEKDSSKTEAEQKEKNETNSEEKNSSKPEADQKEKNEIQKEKNVETLSNNNYGNIEQGKAQNSTKANTKSNTINNTLVSLKNEEKKETAVYNGSNNNYLKKIKIKGVDLNTTFNKENTTYFANVTNTSDLTITAISEDNSAKVSVIGNDSISEGTNKILISVTAENGDVRYYRIFVNCDLKK